MFKNISLGSLLVISALVPAASFAKEPAHPLMKAMVHAEVHHEDKKATSVTPLISVMGKVTAISGTSITLLGNNNITYTVDAANAKLIRRYDGKMVVADIQVNDQLYVQGSFAGTAITAKTIQDFSLQARNATFSGTVQSVTNGSFVIKTANRGSQTILLSGTTKFLKNGASGTSADVVVGATVRVDGVWNNTNSNVTANKVQIVIKQEQIRLNGTVASLNGKTLMVNGSNGKSYTVDVSSAQLSTSVSLSKDWSKLVAGHMVQVWGKAMTGSTTVKASMVIDFSS